MTPRRFRQRRSINSFPGYQISMRLSVATSSTFLEATGNNRKRTAEILGINRKTLYRMAARFEIEFGNLVNPVQSC
jgi:DNA-binding NtrC family response regulator